MKVLGGSPLSPKTSVSVPRLKLELAAVLLGWGFFSWKISLGMIKNGIDLWHLAGINLLINSPPPIILENQNHLNSAIQKYVLVQNLLQYLYLFFLLANETMRKNVGNYRIPLFCWVFFPWTFQLGTHILFLLQPPKQCFFLELQSNGKINCLSSTV